MMEEDANGVYHARTDAWQQIGGYNDIYDTVFDIGTSMNAEKFKFTMPDGQKYVFWTWKGDYINLGAGAELGIYKRLGNTEHWLVDSTNLTLPMTMMIKDRDGNLIATHHPSDPQWWITSFNPKYKNVEADDLTTVYTVDLSQNIDMYKAFKASLNPDDPRFWFFDDKSHTAILIFPMKVCEE